MPLALSPPLRRVRDLLTRIPDDVIALLARAGIGATFWASGQTKIEGLVLDPIGGTFALGVPRLAPSTIDLFRDEYALPLVSPELAAPLAAIAEHVFPLLLVLGLATRLSAAALLGMTLVIQVFVYPEAWPTHATWAAALVFLVARGPGALSLDRVVARRWL